MSSGRPLLVVLTGPSAAGKDTILDRLKARLTAAHFVITATTRPPRSGERDGVDYHFLSREQFLEMISRGELLEHALVYGDYKGVPRQQVLEALERGQDVLMRTDVQGARYIKSVAPETLTIFVTVPSVEELKKRLAGRGADTAAQAEIRLRTATSEMEAAGEFDYTVVNDDLDLCLDEIVEILDRERSQPERRAPSLR